MNEEKKFNMKLRPDQWGRKIYLRRKGYESAFIQEPVSWSTNLSWRRRTEAYLHRRTSHGPSNIRKRWKKADMHGLHYRVKDWRFYNKIHDSNKSHGFVIINL